MTNREKLIDTILEYAGDEFDTAGLIQLAKESDEQLFDRLVSIIEYYKNNPDNESGLNDYMVYFVDPTMCDIFDYKNCEVHVDSFTDEQFIETSKIQGLVWHLSQLQHTFNNNGISDTWLMRIIKNN